jgi:hypothetical protein
MNSFIYPKINAFIIDCSFDTPGEGDDEKDPPATDTNPAIEIGNVIDRLDVLVDVIS